MTTERTGGDAFTCVVCRDTVSAAMSADCNWCSGRYHLNQRNDVEAKDCGQVWIDEQYMALQFACDNCLRRQLASPEPRTVRTQSSRSRRYRRRA